MVLLLVTALPARSATVVASEFFHGEMEHYFVTAVAAEEAALEAGDVWARTATQYRVHDTPGPGLVPVCRFFSAFFAPLSSHFYTANATECEIVRANPRWTFEGIAFFVKSAATDGSCAAGWAPVYRLYNDGLTGAPNHRYTPRRAERADFLARGWLAEGAGTLGVAFCVPVTPDEGAGRLLQLANGVWSFAWSNTIVTVQFGDVRPSFDPDVPFELRDARGFGNVRWDPYLARFVLTTAIPAPVRFVFDLTPAGRIAGCAYESARIVFPPPPYEKLTYGPCRELVGGRSD
jgi:hypothetical protein